MGTNLLLHSEGITWWGFSSGADALGGTALSRGWLLKSLGLLGQAVPPRVKMRRSPARSTVVLPVFPLTPRTAPRGRVSPGDRISESESFLRQTLSNPYVRVRDTQAPATSVTTRDTPIASGRAVIQPGCTGLQVSDWF